MKNVQKLFCDKTVKSKFSHRFTLFDVSVAEALDIVKEEPGERDEHENDERYRHEENGSRVHVCRTSHHQVRVLLAWRNAHENRRSVINKSGNR